MKTLALVAKSSARFVRDLILTAVAVAVLLAAIAVGPPAVAAVLGFAALAGTFWILP